MPRKHLLFLDNVLAASKNSKFKDVKNLPAN